MTFKVGSLAARLEHGWRAGAMLFLCLCASACNESDVAWKTQAKSPDGYWLAEAVNIQAGGMGDATDTTDVKLTRTHAPDDGKIEIISLTPEGADRGGVKLVWLSKRHLEVQYDGKTRVDFQAVKCADVEISLRHVDVVSPLS